jgi:hypothetical protein
MQVGDYDFWKAMDDFEAYMKTCAFCGRLDRERRADMFKFKVFYQDGTTNRLFLSFLAGYSNHALKKRLGLCTE